MLSRSSGVLLHPTSLPGRYGIGDLGEHAFRFVDWLRDCGQTIWQVLPLGPTSYGDSPYQCLSAFAGNTNLISLDKLVEDGFLSWDDLADVPDFPLHRVDYGPVIEYHNRLLDLAYQRYKSNANDSQREAYQAWAAANAHWLDDWALYFAIKNEHGGKPWVEWAEPLALRDEHALKEASQRLEDQINKHRVLQWLFYKQWGELKQYANHNGIRLVGDIPIFVAHDSSDVWANRERFYLDEKGYPEVVAGVPPDYFSATGQRWGNPLYRWDVMRSTGYQWWISRFEGILELVDMVRIDHFRGFEAYWEIPAHEETAVNGRWVKGPGIEFFHAVREKLGDLPIIAEDLGEITKEVVELRDTLGLPGMKILQFAWSDPNNPFLPHNYVKNCVAYSGTHDNNTTLGWWHENEPGDHGKQMLAEYVGHEVTEPHWELIKLGMGSVAAVFIAPMQDILGYGADTRMNTPGVQGGNWAWRFVAEKFGDPAKDRLAHLTWFYRRRADQQQDVYGDVAKR
ncbi:MAG: 4-alpha-glucanotransferase [Phototrophicales bacterium]|nr:MAG: 4-alpha-glucanotransferase [Phototrophicales bacterium]RMG71756.1 MAG: 4-alpha-glucanotransferase [Chloroflexota bacterium]